MYIVMVTPECAPVAKVGGLADVVFGLSREIEIRGNAVEIILPKYDCMRHEHVWGLTLTMQDLWVPWGEASIHCSVWFGFVHGRKCFFIEPHSPDKFFERGVYYGHQDDPARFAFFSKAALEFLLQSGKHPDVIHCHDWQTGLVPVLLYELYQHQMSHPRVCYTIHNFKHQGQTDPLLLNAAGLHRPEYYMQHDRLLDPTHPDTLNLMKAGIVYSNFTTTVSPKHAWEAQHTNQAHGLAQTLHAHSGKFGGVLNGIDYEHWNPETDPHIPHHYSSKKLTPKYNCKEALRTRLLLEDSARPIVAFIGRLDPQKGIDLVRHALFYSLEHNAQFILLGSSPDPEINGYFWHLKHHFNNHPNCHIEVGFDEDLAHLIYAGSDLMIVPSLFEPCGLTQMIALRYGTVPVVRSVGGLADTVFDKDHSDRAPHDRNGFVFETPNNQGLESALGRAIRCWHEHPTDFRHLMHHGMACDYSWNHPGRDYLNIYDLIRNK
jgi:starch synthase